MQPTPDEDLREQLRDTFPALGLDPLDRPSMTHPPAADLRRFHGVPPPAEDVELLALVRDPDGILRWEVGSPALQILGTGRRAGGAGMPKTVIEQFRFEKIPPNKIGRMLEAIDSRLTPPRGLRRWDPATRRLEAFDGAHAAGKRILLFIHGTFSNCDNTLAQLLAAPDGAGRELLDVATEGGRYDHVLTFDHPTVGVSPAMNAFDLASALRPSPAAIDIVAHSRGGLVARWYLEGFADNPIPRRAVLVATSIAGTSLAAPHRLRAGIDYLANIGSMLGKAATKVPHPFVTASGALLGTLSSLVKLGASTPALDAAVAMIPGLQGQSRVGNNPELLRLRANHRPDLIEYFAVRADFQPRDPGWNFLRYFSRPLQRAGNWAADIIFDGDNDLVVDTDAMLELADGRLIEADRVHDFGTSETVQHTNYFQQPETLAFIRDRLKF